MGYKKEEIRKDFINNIKELCNAHGVSGFENDVVELVKSKISDYVDSIEVDALGNLIALKKGNGKKKLMIVAHTDEIGLIIKKIDSKGFLWFDTLGGISPQNLFGKHVIIKTNKGYVDGIVHNVKPGRPEGIAEIPKIEDFFIEIGAENKEEAALMGVEVGNPVSIDYPVYFLGKNGVAGKALDDRAALFMLIELLKLFKDSKDIPDVPERKLITELNKGPVIKIMDKLQTNHFGIIATPQVVEDLKKASKNAQLDYQLEVYSRGSTDAAAIQTEKGGIASGGVCFPTRYVHSYEVASIDDIVQCVELLYSYVKILA